jgi:hypothetical protein
MQQQICFGRITVHEQNNLQQRKQTTVHEQNTLQQRKQMGEAFCLLGERWAKNPYSFVEGKNLTTAHPCPPASRQKSELDVPARDSNRSSSHHPRIPSRYSSHPILESGRESPARLTWPRWRWTVRGAQRCCTLAGMQWMQCWLPRFKWADARGANHPINCYVVHFDLEHLCHFRF